MINLKERLTEIQAKKTEDLQKINDLEIDYAILEQEIKDVNECLKALEIDEHLMRNSLLLSYKCSTTSGSLYDALVEYLKEQKELEIELELNPNNDAEVKFSDNLSLSDLKHIAEEYGKLVNEHADLLHFKEVALKHLTEDQIDAIDAEMQEIAENTQLGEIYMSQYYGLFDCEMQGFKGSFAHTNKEELIMKGAKEVLTHAKKNEEAPTFVEGTVSEAIEILDYYGYKVIDITEKEYHTILEQNDLLFINEVVFFY